MGTTKVLVTGGSGFIGTNLVSHYKSIGSEVMNLDMNSPRNPELLDNWLDVNILNANQLSSLISDYKPHIVYHLAARTDLDGSSLDCYKANIVGVENLLKAIQSVSSIKRVLIASSRLVCKIGHVPTSFDDYCPPNLYGESKMIGEQIVKNYSHSRHYNWLLFRPTSIWGPWFDVPYKQFFESVITNKYVHPGNRCIPKSFGYVGNSVYQLEALSRADSAMVSGKTFYLADYPPIDVLNMANLIRETMQKSNVRSAPLFALHVIAKIGDFAKSIGYKHPPLTSFRLANLLTPMIYDVTELESVVGDLPFSLEEGVAATLNWIAKYQSA